MFSDENHPIWRLLNLVVILGFITFFSWLNATSFDKTEFIMISELVLVLGGWQEIKQKYKKKPKKKDNCDG